MLISLAGCKPEVEEHEHTFAKSWTSDAEYHWHAATCEHGTEVKDKAKHSFGDWTVITQPTAEETKERECSVCHYKMEETIEKPELYETPIDAESGEVATAAFSIRRTA